MPPSPPKSQPPPTSSTSTASSLSDLPKLSPGMLWKSLVVDVVYATLRPSVSALLYPCFFCRSRIVVSSGGTSASRWRRRRREEGAGTTDTGDYSIGEKTHHIFVFSRSRRRAPSTEGFIVLDAVAAGTAIADVTNAAAAGVGTAANAAVADPVPPEDELGVELEATDNIESPFSYSASWRNSRCSPTLRTSKCVCTSAILLRSASSRAAALLPISARQGGRERSHATGYQLKCGYGVIKYGHHCTFAGRLCAMWYVVLFVGHSHALDDAVCCAPRFLHTCVAYVLLCVGLRDCWSPQCCCVALMWVCCALRALSPDVVRWDALFRC